MRDSRAPGTSGGHRSIFDLRRPDRGVITQAVGETMLVARSADRRLNAPRFTATGLTRGCRGRPDRRREAPVPRG